MIDVFKVKYYIILCVLLRYNLQENKEEVIHIDVLLC
jgi:hypothetical protein